VVDVGEKERGRERMCECERGGRERKRGGMDKECLSV
jgi:hypothetical protein